MNWSYQLPVYATRFEEVDNCDSYQARFTPKPRGLARLIFGEKPPDINSCNNTVSTSMMFLHEPR